MVQVVGAGVSDTQVMALSEPLTDGAVWVSAMVTPVRVVDPVLVAVKV